MKICDIIRQKRPVSFEIFPPKGELSMKSFRETLDALSALHPDFISVTCSAGGSGNHDRTAELAGIIQKEYGIASCAHLTCVNSDSTMLAADVDALQKNGIENVLALRGDVIPDVSSRVFAHAVELMGYLRGKDFASAAHAIPRDISSVPIRHRICGTFTTSSRRARRFSFPSCFLTTSVSTALSTRRATPELRSRSCPASCRPCPL